MRINYNSFILQKGIFSELDDERRLAWRPTTDYQTDGQLKSGWYRFMNGLQKINEECTPTSYGGKNN